MAQRRPSVVDSVAVGRDTAAADLARSWVRRTHCCYGIVEDSASGAFAGCSCLLAHQIAVVVEEEAFELRTVAEGTYLAVAEGIVVVVVEVGIAVVAAIVAVVAAAAAEVEHN